MTIFLPLWLLALVLYVGSAVAWMFSFPDSEDMYLADWFHYLVGLLLLTVLLFLVPA